MPADAMATDDLEPSRRWTDLYRLLDRPGLRSKTSMPRPAEDKEGCSRCFLLRLGTALSFRSG